MSDNMLVIGAGLVCAIVVVGDQIRHDRSMVADAVDPIEANDLRTATIVAARQAAVAMASSPRAEPDTATLTAIVQNLCATCHNADLLTGGLSLDGFSITNAPESLEAAEAIITKLRLDMMPPPGIPRPGRDTLLALAASLEDRIDRAAAGHPFVGQRPLQRMNRAEYENAIRTMFGLEIDANAFLPGETISDGFDNLADVQVLSGTLLDGYLRAAEEVTRRVVGDPNASPRQASYTVPKSTNQMGYVEGAPYGTRGGVVVTHTFPADGDYVFRGGFIFNWVGELFGMEAEGEQLEIAIDGERVALLDIDRWMHESDPLGIMVESQPIAVRAGQRVVSATFVSHFDGPVEEILAPIGQSVADTEISQADGMTTLPHLGELRIAGPYDVTGVSDNPLRDRVFTCRPALSAEERACAASIIDRVATQAYRRPLAPVELDRLLALYETAAVEDGFEVGLGVAIQAVLSSPNFIFKVEEMPAGGAADAPHPLNDYDLATRLAQFIWATLPDQELLGLAERGVLNDDHVLSEQVSRMLRDPRSETLATRFATQWLRIPALDALAPDPLRHPEFDERLRNAMRRETELFFYNIVREDRPVLELMTADYTFANELLATHYGIPGVSGLDFRRVQHVDPQRHGLLGQGSVLALTSFASRTSPVNRGKWVMEVLLGTEPPPPPPNVPDLDVTEAVDAGSGRVLTVRERMEMHRSNPACNSCHQFIDPLGLPLENWSATGQWRVRDEMNPIDSRGNLWTGTPIQTPQELRTILVQEFTEPILRNFAENMLRYALGRRVHAEDQSTVRSVVREAADSEYRFSAFVTAVATSPSFRMQVSNQTVASARDQQ